MTWEAPGVLSLELVAPDGSDLPRIRARRAHRPASARRHMRQYSLCGDPADRRAIASASARSRAGCRRNSFTVSCGRANCSRVSVPRNNFPLVDAQRYVFVAGGIGITPLIPMMRAGERQRAARGPCSIATERNEDAPFLDEIHALGGEVSLHRFEAGTRLDVAQQLGAVRTDTVVYCCGPERPDDRRRGSDCGLAARTPSTSNGSRRAAGRTMKRRAASKSCARPRA